MEACKDEDIGMNIYTRALPATGGNGGVYIYFFKIYITRIYMYIYIGIDMNFIYLHTYYIYNVFHKNYT